jgi:spore coat polysaccharide biosynthesis protein SpsF (cytidylyltransferase family)/aryl-alcohol dehydrogenase-like predicted oxidoreductase
MNSRGPATVVIQSRLSSLRLPGKALLPVAGLPTVVLCARRAANSGLKVVVATSDSSVDDTLAEVVRTAGLECFRGPHDDVLLRFAQATRAAPEQAVVVRLTADNLFPDGQFVTDVLQQFDRSEVDYLAAASPTSGLPYGLSAEVFTVAALRRAERSTHEPYDREHVTPWIRRTCGIRLYQPPMQHAHWPRLRCTLDTFEDYQVLLRVFADVPDPVGVGWQELVRRLTAVSPGGTAPRCPFHKRTDGSIHSILTLGTAQFGSSYGIANDSGMPTETEVHAILSAAADAGITSIDTASAYGVSEQRIGAHLPPNFADRIRITTKLDVPDLPADTPPHVVAAAVDASVFKSLYRLARRRIDALLLHRWAHHDAWSGAVWRRLLELRREGLIAALGASVSTPGEAMEALADADLGQLQCPVNVLDSRWRSADFLSKVAARNDVVVHARSVLLQGMLTLPATRWVGIPGVDASRLCDTLDELTARLGRRDRVDLCMAYAAALPWVTSLVVGVESVQQLRANLQHAQAPRLSREELALVDAAIPPLPEALLNPALWRNSSV